jgi:hypothetical protein
MTCYSTLPNKGEHLNQCSCYSKAAPQEQKFVDKASAINCRSVNVNGEDEVIEMTRMGKLIAHHVTARCTNQCARCGS